MSIPLNEELDFAVIRLSTTEAVKRFLMEGLGYGVILESAGKLELTYGELQTWSRYEPFSVVANVVTRPAERLSKSVWFFLNHIRK